MLEWIKDNMWAFPFIVFLIMFIGIPLPCIISDWRNSRAIEREKDEHDKVTNMKDYHFIISMRIHEREDKTQEEIEDDVIEVLESVGAISIGYKVSIEDQ